MNDCVDGTNFYTALKSQQAKIKENKTSDDWISRIKSTKIKQI
jgi:hypothetical protein